MEKAIKSLGISTAPRPKTKPSQYSINVPLNTRPKRQFEFYDRFFFLSVPSSSYVRCWVSCACCGRMTCTPDDAQTSPVPRVDMDVLHIRFPLLLKKNSCRIVFSSRAYIRPKPYSTYIHVICILYTTTIVYIVFHGNEQRYRRASCGVKS